MTNRMSLDQLEDVEFEINFLPEKEMDLTAKLIVEVAYTYYDEMMNVWFWRMDGKVVFDSEEREMSTFIPLEH
jgi:hypothetical protein